MKFIQVLIILVLVSPPAWPDRRELWNKDIDIFSEELQARHINPFSKLAKEDFLADIQSLKAGIDRKTDFQITVELMKITRKIGDGHTAVHFQHGRELFDFPLELYDDSGTWRVIGVSEKHKDILGSELKYIDGHTTSEIRDALSDVVQFVENPNSLKQRIAQYIKYADLLHELGITDSPDTAVFTFMADDEEVAVQMNARSSEIDFIRLETSRPHIKKLADTGIPGLWYGEITQTEAIYIGFSSYPSFDQMDGFGKKLLQYIRENAVRQLVIDLRGNGGGDFYVGLWLAYYLNLADGVDWLNGVYTLVDNDTFSAATINAAQYKQLLNATIVGEPTGSNPSGFQDMGTFTLPHSGLMISYSKRLFRLQQDASDGLQPDIGVSYSWDAYVSGEDNILQWVVDEIKTSPKEAAGS